MKFEKDDISDKMRQAALFAMAPEAVVENRLAGRRDLDNHAKVRCMIYDPPDVNQLKLREMTLDFAEEASEGGSDIKLRPKARKIFERNCRNAELCFAGKSKGKSKKGSVEPGLLHGRTVAGNVAETACGGKPPDAAAVCGNRESH